MDKTSDSKSTISSGISWIRKHPILFNLMLIALAACAVVWAGLSWLDSWTGHGLYEIVPDVKGLSYSRAGEVLRSGNLTAELSDSIYDDRVAPGTVVDQMPKKNDKVKPHRTVYLTINAFSPKAVTLPDFNGMSVRQAQSVLDGYGFRNVRINHVPSEYKDLVLGAKFNGIALKGGTRVPVSASITLEVGEGFAAADDTLSPDSDSQVMDNTMEVPAE